MKPSGLRSVTATGALRAARQQAMGTPRCPRSALPSSKARSGALSREPSDAKESSAGVRARVAARLPPSQRLQLRHGPRVVR